jgi:hypothetical protein
MQTQKAQIAALIAAGDRMAQMIQDMYLTPTYRLTGERTALDAWKEATGQATRERQEQHEYDLESLDAIHERELAVSGYTPYEGA